MSSNTPSTAAEVASQPSGSPSRGQSQTLNQEDTEKALASVQSKLRQSETQQQLINDIKALADASLSIDASFGKVAVLLGEMEEKAGVVSEKYKEAVVVLKPKWEVLRKKYVGLLWNSKKVASSAQSFISDLLEIFVPKLKDPNVALNEKLDDMDAYIRIVENHEKKASGTSKSFQDLQNEVKAFLENDWTPLTSKFEETEEMKALAEDVKTRNETIETARADLKKVQKDITSTINICIGLGIAAGVCFLLGFLCPQFFLLSFLAAFAAGLVATDIPKLRKKEETLQKKIDENTKARDLSQTKLDELKNALAAITSAARTGETELGSVLTKIGLFSAVWTTLKTDLGDIRETMKAAIARGSHKAVYDRIPVLEVMYTALSMALWEYQVAIPKNSAVFKNVEGGGGQ